LVFLAQNDAPETAWRPGSARTRWGSLSAPPGPLAAVKGLDPQGGGGERRGEGKEGRGEGREGEVREEVREGVHNFRKTTPPLIRWLVTGLR